MARPPDDDRPAQGLERGRADPLGEVADVLGVRGARAAALEMGVQHPALELRELTVELERDLLAYSCAYGLRIHRAHDA